MTKNEGHQHGFWTRMEDVVAPRFCVGCRYRLSECEQFVCTDCLQKTERTDFARHPTDNLMARMLWARTNVQRAATVFHYHPSSALSFAIQELKYNHKPELARYIGQLAAEELIRTDFLEDIDAFVPVPITRERCLERGYNQSLLIAEGMRDVTGIPILNEVLERTFFLKSQTQMSMLQRQTNVAGAFRLADGEALRNKHVLLVDDVMTTGATMSACCLELQQAPDVRVSVFALALTQF